MVSILSPVGTSLFKNFSSSPEFRGVAEGFGIGEWASMPFSDPRNEYPDGEVCRYTESKDLMDSLLKFVSLDPRRSCAELAGILGIYEDLRARYGRIDSITVSLYSTASCTSYLASEVVARHLKSQGMDAVMRVVEAIRSEEEFDEGLASLVDAVSEDIAEYSRRGYRVYVNATPGFKPEVTFLVLAALLLGASSVYYIHEAFRGAVRLPAIPVHIGKSHLALLEKLAREGGVELSHAYGVMGLTEDYVRELEDRYLAYVDEEVLKPRKWVVKLLEKLRHSRM